MSYSHRETLAWLAADRGLALPMIVRRQHTLAEVLRTKEADQAARGIQNGQDVT